MTPIAERAEGLSLLLRAAADAPHTGGRIVFVTGEAGIGKSRLVEDLLARLPESTIRASASCERLSTTRHFGPFVDMADCLGQTFARDVDAAIAGPDPLGAIGKALMRLAPGTVLAIDDIQNADPGSIDLLKYVVSRIRTKGLLLVGTFRPEEVNLDHPLTALLAQCPADCSQQFELPPFSREETAAACDQKHASVEEVYRLTGGNPLLISEVLRTGFKRGQPLPEGINRCAKARLARMTPPQRRWIELLAAVPPPHGAGLVTALALEFGLDPAQIPDRGGFLKAGSNGEFNQEAMRLAVVAHLSEFDLAGLRIRLSQLLQSCGADTSNAESLFRLALECEDARAIAANAVPAARLAEARSDLHDCVSYLSQALPFAKIVDPALHAQITELWACRTAVHEGIGERTIALISQNLAYWKRQNAPMALGMTNLLLGRLLNYRAEPCEAQQAVSQAIACLAPFGPGPELVSAHVLAAELHLARGDGARAEVSVKATERAARHVKDEAAYLECTLAQAMLSIWQGRRGQAWRRLETVFDRARSLDLHELAARTQIAACDAALGAFDLDRAESWVDRKSALQQSALSNCWKTALAGRMALIAVHRGELHRAIQLARATLEDIAAPPIFAFPAMLAEAVAKARLGEPDADTMLLQQLDLARQLDNSALQDAVRLFRIEFLFLSGRYEEASDLWRELGARSDAGSVAELRALWGYRLGLGQPVDLPELAAPIAQELEGDAVGAAQAWRDAGYGSNAVVALLFASVEALECALQRARTDSDAMHFNAAREAILRQARRHGIAMPDAVRRRGPYRASRSHPLGLTRREVDILRMIVDGVSNREIAERLGRSLRTIEHHVSAILSKMGIENRVQAALYAVVNPEVIEP